MELRLDGALQASTEAERDAEQNTHPLTSPHLDRGAGHDRARHAEPNVPDDQEPERTREN
ncbi:hypothetical protein [Plantibacter sp. YIM 135249]|uniref:hypothetical protein n=1 Tax=Plantibacter sp. YIM 135249 TaxID=3423918 RepID=UPI003D32E4F5